MRISIAYTTQQELSDDTVKRVVGAYLHHLKEERWVRDGRVYSEGYTSHRFDIDEGDVNDPKWEVLREVLRFEKFLTERKLL